MHVPKVVVAEYPFFSRGLTETGAYIGCAQIGRLLRMLLYYIESDCRKGIDRYREDRHNAGLHTASVAWGSGRWAGCVEER
jgi:hypothetical protein